MIDIFSIEITGNCNLRCRYCCRSDINTAASIANEITKEEVLRLIGQLNEVGVGRFMFTGGEPFLCDYIFEAVGKCRADVEVFTNGMLLGGENAARIADSRIRTLVVSLDGLEAQRLVRVGGDARTILENIRRVKARRPDIQIVINTLLLKSTLAEVDELYEELRQLGIARWSMDFPQKRGRYKEASDEDVSHEAAVGKLAAIVRRHFKNGCPFQIRIHNFFDTRLGSSPLKMPPRETHPCSYLVGKSFFLRGDRKYILCPSLDFTVGEMSADVRRDIEAVKRAAFLEMKLSDLKECVDCRYFKICQGGCRADAYLATGSWHRRDPRCCSLMVHGERLFFDRLGAPLTYFQDNLNLAGSIPKLESLN